MLPPPDIIRDSAGEERWNADVLKPLQFWTRHSSHETVDDCERTARRERLEWDRGFEGERVRFADCVWLEPRVRAELTSSELVKGRLRDPVFRGLVAR